MGHLEGNFTPSYIWDARFLKVNLVSRRVKGQLHAPAAFANPHPVIEMKLDGTRCGFVRFVEDKNLFALLEIEPRIAQPVGSVQSHTGTHTIQA